MIRSDDEREREREGEREREEREKEREIERESVHRRHLEAWLPAHVPGNPHKPRAEARAALRLLR